jgi:uncharacterized protein GlcG (DUF336 family)
MRHLIVTLTLVTATLITLPNANAAEERPILTASAAMTMVHGCLAKAQAEGWLMHIAIIDNHGNLKAYHRMDDAQLLSQDVSLAKARTSAVINQSTKQWGEMAFSGGGPGPAAFVPGMNHFEGGLPIMTAADDLR